MKLKISLFNRHIIKSDLKRFWWVSALYAIILFFLLPLHHMLQDFPINEDWQKEALLYTLRYSTKATSYSILGRCDLQILLIYTLPIFLAVMLFSYLHSNRAVTVLHSLPLDRKTLLGSHAASGILLISAPVFFIAGILAILASFTGLGECYTVVNVMEWAGLTLLFNILLFSIAVFVGMFTGNAIAHIIFTYIINVLPYGLYMLVGYNLEKLLYGFNVNSLSSGWARALPLLRFFGFSINDFTIVQGLLYLIVAFAFLGAAGLAYNKRKLEAAGNIVAFKTIQPVFKYGVAICLMLTGGFIIGYVNHSGKAAVIAGYFIFAFLGYWISQMLLEKTVRVWHAYKGYLTFNAVILLMIVFISADVTGYVRYVPQYSEIESVYYGWNYHAWLREKNKLPEDLYFRTEGLFKEEGNIKTAMSLHRVLAENRVANDGREKYLAYILKNGRSVVRKYNVKDSAVSSFVVPLYESLEYRREKYPVLSQNAQDIKLIEIGDNRTSKKPLILSDQKQVQGFMENLQRELVDADYKEITEPEDEYTYIQITDRNNRRYNYSLRRSFSTLYSWLEDNGYYKSVMLLPEEIDHVALQSFKITQYKGSKAYSATGSSMDISDGALIKELVEICHARINTGEYETYLRLVFYIRAGSVERDFESFIYPGTPMSEALQQKLGELGRN